MIKYFILFSDGFTESDQIESHLASQGFTVFEAMNFDNTYKVTVEEETTFDTLEDVLLVQRADDVVSAASQYSLDHINYLKNDYSTGQSFTPKYNGAGTQAYIIDTGIDWSHVEFENKTASDVWTNFGTDFADSTGHGTAVGSLIVGENIGVAPSATLHNVKLFDANSSNITIGEIIDCLDAVLGHHIANTESAVKVVCMPWTIDQNDFLDAKVKELMARNLVPVVSAGNDGVNVDTKSPAGVDKAITVGAFNRNYEVTSFTNLPTGDTGSYFTNYGAQVDFFTLGVDVSTADLAGGYATTSGTSLSAGIATGVALHHIQAHAEFSAESIKNTMLAEGHTRGTAALVFDDTLDINYADIYKSIATVEAEGETSFCTTPSGSIAVLRHSDSLVVDLGIKEGVTNVAALDFAPTPDWVYFNEETGEVHIEALPSEDVTPGTFLFAIKGTIAGDTVVEEYSISVYNELESELDGDNAKTYYYDADLAEYDEVVNYQVAPLIKN